VVERAELVELVRAHHPADALERDAVASFLSELERLERPWDETADPVHVTASAVVVGARGTVLHRHRVLGKWLQPGGHIEAGESPPDAARREVAEETGLAGEHPLDGPLLLRVDVHRAGEALGHVHLDLCYLLASEDRDPEPGEGESPDARWWGWDEAREVADDALRGALDAARRRGAGR
jgi:8-oxo-dGTP pyrophosphatase MutT (NUDIX family)